MKSGADFQQTGNSSAECDSAFGWINYPAQNLEQSRFACAVPANDADCFTLPDFQTDVMQRPELLAYHPVRSPAETLSLKRSPNQPLDRMTQSISLLGAMPDDVAL